MIKVGTLLNRLFQAGLVTFGLLLTLGGAKLLSLNGSLWYLTAGITLTLSGLLLWRGIRWGSWLFGSLYICTIAWSLWEVGLDAWALVPRLLLLSLCGLWLVTPIAQSGITSGPARIVLLAKARKSTSAGLLILIVAVTAGVLALSFITPDATPPHITDTSTPEGSTDWLHYGNDTFGTRYSQLAQINASNAEKLKPAWSFRTGDIGKPGQEYNFEATPLKAGNSLYTCTPSGQVVALDAITGQLLWHFKSTGDLRDINSFVCRGVTWHQVKPAPGECNQRVYVATPDGKLWSLDAATGLACKQFGTAGAIDILEGLGQVRAGTYAVTSPPVITRGLLIFGAKVQDNLSVDMPSGVVRAYDAVTGQLVWAWDVGRPDHKGKPSENETYTRSTPNAWAPLTADDNLGLVYIPTGNPAADFWGKQRRDFDDAFGSSIVAVDVRDGSTRWKFQVTHRDVWDNDISAQPLLADIPSDNGTQPAIIVGTKQGQIFVLNRENGQPIVPIEEKPAPRQSTLGENLSPTQPSSALSVNPGPDRLTEASMWGATPIDQMWCRIQFRRARYEGPYTPPGTDRPSIVYPGMFGGIEWGGLSFDPQRNILIANANAMPFIVRMATAQNSKISDATTAHHPEGTSDGLSEVYGTGLAASFYGFLSPLKIPCMQPPWGKLYAIDLTKRQKLWERPVGTVRDTGPLGIRSHLPLLIGTPQAGGTVITRGNVIFAAATLDQYLRAYDLQTGREIWKARLPAGGQATPMTYEADGKQYVVISSGGHAVLGTTTGDYILAFALGSDSNGTKK